MNNLKRLRERLGLSQDRLGELSGVSRFAIIDYEAGRSSPTYQIAKKMATALRCSLSDLDDSVDISPEECSKHEVDQDIWEVLVVLEDRDDWGRESMMDLRNDGCNRFSIHVGPTKVGVEIVGRIESEAELDGLLAEAREKALAAMELQRRQKR